jgi:hypothetical protein
MFLYVVNYHLRADAVPMDMAAVKMVRVLLRHKRFNETFQNKRVK